MDIEKRIVLWMRKKLKEAKAKGFIIGLSGGIDSSVCALLSKKASKNTLALIMPCESLREDLEDAQFVAKKFKIKSRVVNLTSVFKNFLKILPKADLRTKGNLKARLRMATLYYFANLKNCLVVGTSNKTEITFGYSTKYGDAAADILPLGSFTKAQVRKLGYWLGVPDRIINKPPSAGLWKGQTDEGEIGLSYEVMDKIAENYKKINRLNRELRQKIKTYIQKAAHKQKLPEIFTP